VPAGAAVPAPGPRPAVLSDDIASLLEAVGDAVGELDPAGRRWSTAPGR